MFIELKNITKTIKGVNVLEDISFRFESGKIYGLKGKNGAGKTMLMRAISGLIRVSEGEINIEGVVLGRDISFPKSIGVLIENPAFIDGYTGFKNLRVLASIQDIIGDEEIKSVLNEVGLDWEDKRSYKKYSLGMKQRLGIAAAIMENPEIIILDEPINALDESGAAIVRKILEKHKQRGAIIILACHDTEELEYLSDVIITISQGRISDVS